MASYTILHREDAPHFQARNDKLVRSESMHDSYIADSDAVGEEFLKVKTHACAVAGGQQLNSDCDDPDERANAADDAEVCEALDDELRAIKRRAAWVTRAGCDTVHGHSVCIPGSPIEASPPSIYEHRIEHSDTKDKDMRDLMACSTEDLMQDFRTGTMESLASYLSGSLDSDSDSDDGDFPAQPPIQTERWGISALRNMGYELGEVLTKGSLTVLRRASRHSDGGDVAVRCVCSRQEAVREAVRKEYELVSALRHRSIVKHEAMFESRFDVWLCMELCPLGDVQSYVGQHGPFQEAAGWNLNFQLIEGVRYLHRKRVAHNDLQPSGLLLQGGASVLKIGGFGMAIQLGVEEDHAQQKRNFANRMFGDQGSSTYAAPELILGKPWNERIDIWSSGLCAYFLLRGFLPISSEGPGRAGVTIQDAAWQGFSGVARHFLEQCLTEDMRDRPTATELLLHPVFWQNGALRKGGAGTVAAGCPMPIASHCMLMPASGLLFCGKAEPEIMQVSPSLVMPKLSAEAPAVMATWKEHRSSKDSFVRLALNRWGRSGAGACEASLVVPAAAAFAPATANSAAAFPGPTATSTAEKKETQNQYLRRFYTRM